MGAIFPDLLATLYDYPGVRVNMHCNQNNAAGDITIFYGKEATHDHQWQHAYRGSAGYAAAAGRLLAEWLDGRSEAEIPGRMARGASAAAGELGADGDILCSAGIR